MPLGAVQAIHRTGLRASASELRDTLGHLRTWMAQKGA
jgi:hypothetical protein